MTPERVYLIAALTLALAGFFSGRPRIDLTALLLLIALLIPWRRAEAGGLEAILTVDEAFSGFGSPALVMVASMFVLSAAMQLTGAAHRLGSKVLRRCAGSELGLQVSVLVLVTLFSAFVNDTTAVLVWMPLVLAVCRDKGYSPSRVLLLVAFASLLGGQWTLIGTRSNVIASDYLRSRTGESLGFFAFTPAAAAVFAACFAWFVLAGRRALPGPEGGTTLAARYGIPEFVTEVLVAPVGAKDGRTLAELGLERVKVIGVVRGEAQVHPAPSLRLKQGDVLIVQGQMDHISQLLQRPELEIKQELRMQDGILRSSDLRMVEAIVPPRSWLEGLRVDWLDLEQRYGVSVLAVGSRSGRTGRMHEQRIQVGDSLLMVGHEEALVRLRDEPDLILTESRAFPVLSLWRARLALGLLVFVAVTAATRLLAPPVATLIAACTCILFGCVSPAEAYRNVDWRTLVVLGAMIPAGLALEKTGTADLAAQVLGGLASSGPWLPLAGLLLVATLLTQIIENAAVTVILAPIAYELGVATGNDPAVFLIGMAICTSAGFVTPWAHESTLLVMGPGNYRPRHYFALGVPFAVLTWVCTLLVLWLRYPMR